MSETTAVTVLPEKEAPIVEALRARRVDAGYVAKRWKQLAERAMRRAMADTATAGDVQAAGQVLKAVSRLRGDWVVAAPTHPVAAPLPTTMVVQVVQVLREMGQGGVVEVEGTVVEE